MMPHPNRPWKPAIAALLLLGLASAHAAADGPKHGLSAFGDLKVPADFKHFKWVNPDAPKGGRLKFIGTAARNTFDSFNDFILKGDAAQGLGLLFDSLMTRNVDEPDAVYGLVAHSAELTPDRSAITFRMRPETRFADGSPVTSADVVFSFYILKEKGHPAYRVVLRDVAKAEAIDPLTVRFAFAVTTNRDLPLVVAGLPVLSKAFYATRKFEETTLEPPLGSGPYKIGDFKPGTFVSYRRRDDYWGKNLPVNRGRFNFDEVRYDYFRDRTAALLALKAGELDLREEFTSRDWMTQYDVPAVNEGRLLKIEVPDYTPSGAQGFFLNTRRSQFADPRLRKAFDYAFDFQFTNATLFYGLYTRTESFFENSTMKAEGKPSAEELALLEPFREMLPPEVFEEPYRPPVSDGSGKDRKLLQTADRLLKDAGWQIKDSKRTNAKGEVLNVEFLIDIDPSSERVITGYVESLRRLGVLVNVRRVEAAEYQRRLKTFDFDVVIARYTLRSTPGAELRNFWSSEAAKTDGSANLAGISHPAIDALIAKAIEAKSREELQTALRALDRVLRAGHYWVPQWYKPVHHVAHWDKYSRPDDAKRPRYDRGIGLDTWWYDAAKAARLKKN
jgi:microcin C transport system substrate-binding protein